MLYRCHKWAYDLAHTRALSLSYLTGAVPQRSAKAKTALNQKNSGPSTDSNLGAKKASNIPRSVESLIITPKGLTDHFRSEAYPKPHGSLVNTSQKVFNNSNPVLEWTLADYNEIPDVKEAIRAREVSNYKPKQLTVLPEVLFLGHTNSGKSSLINNLLLSAKEGKTSGASTEYAFVSNRAGYTRTMNCYKVGNKFRLVDSPGYGMFGKEEQGQMVVEYIQRRKVLRRAFVLVDSSQGFQEEDLQIVDLLVNEGTPFEIVFTKVDLVIASAMKKHGVSLQKVADLKARQKNMVAVELANQDVIDHFRNTIDQAQLFSLPSFPRLLFNNAVANKMVSKRYGYKEIRATIVESCGL